MGLVVAALASALCCLSYLQTSCNHMLMRHSPYSYRVLPTANAVATTQRRGGWAAASAPGALDGGDRGTVALSARAARPAQGVGAARAPADANHSWKRMLPATSGPHQAARFVWDPYGSSPQHWGRGVNSIARAADGDWLSRMPAAWTRVEYGSDEFDVPELPTDERVTLAVGQVPFKLAPKQLRWVIRRLTGVTAYRIVEHRSRQRERTGLFFVDVLQHDAGRVLAAHKRALCTGELLWEPSCGAAAAEIIAMELKANGTCRNGLLSVELRMHRTGDARAASNNHTVPRCDDATRSIGEHDRQLLMNEWNTPQL